MNEVHHRLTNLIITVPLIVVVLLINCQLSSTAGPITRGLLDPDADVPIKRINAGHATALKIPLEETLERIRSYPHRKDALIRSLGATALKQRAGRNLIFRVLLTIGFQNDLTECTARVMCEITCEDETNRAANSYFDTYPTDDYYVTYVLEAIEKGRELGNGYSCGSCQKLYPFCQNDKLKRQVIDKYYYLFEVTNYVLEKLPA
ncbi:uncharacterized protein LOC128955490 [Oppia nitens]|uniref:uncharacterized protein LOC128955490 n=1 Tax=Oppia nitens TaxID=1686743 RepID=UPI0023DB32EF|nr:uncharacterized protein LOC128955490 [Oppia nitens]